MQANLLLGGLLIQLYGRPLYPLTVWEKSLGISLHDCTRLTEADRAATTSCTAVIDVAPPSLSVPVHWQCPAEVSQLAPISQLLAGASSKPPRLRLAVY